MRDIKEILMELLNHPDYVGGIEQVWTKENLVDEMSHHYQYEYDNSDILLDESHFTDEDWDEISFMIEEFYSNHLETNGLPWNMSNLEDFDARNRLFIDRMLNLNKLI